MTVTAIRPATQPGTDPVPLAAVQGTLALDLRQPWEPPPPRPLEAAPSAPATRVDDGPDDSADHSIDLGTVLGDRDEVTTTVVAPRGRGADIDEVAQGFARALVEVIGGERGAGQVLRWVSPDVYAQLLQRADLLARTVPDDRRVRRLRSRLAGVRVSCPATGVAELSIHLRRGERSHAVAARLEHRVQRRRGRLGAAWMCVALEIG